MIRLVPRVAAEKRDQGGSMRGLKRVGRLRAHTAVLAGVTALALGVTGLGAGSASAAVSCEGSNITGEGTPAQAIAQQQIWIPGFEEVACQGEGPTISY